MTDQHPLRLVLLSTSEGWGGLEMNLFRHARWMAQEGHIVRLLCVADSPLHKAAMAFIQGDEGKALTIDCRTIRQNSQYFAVATAIHRATRLIRYRADWLWVRDPRDLDASALARRIVGLLGGKTRLLVQQGMQIPKPKKSPFHRFRFNAVDAWVSPLHWLKEQVNSRTTVAPEDTHVIPLGLDDGWFEPRPTGDQLRRQCRLELGLSQESFVITMVGRIDRKKGQTTLIRALAEMPPDAHALIVGDPTLDELSDYFDEVRQLVRRKELQWRVHFRPYMDFPRSAFIAADVVAVCSQQESVGSVTLEAMASGCAIMGTDSGGTAEILADGRGWTFPADDSETMAAKLMDLRNNAEIMPERIEAGKSYIAHHRRQEVVKLWDELLRTGRLSEG